MNSWTGGEQWGKQGYAWVPSEMIDWAEIAFSTKKQKADMWQHVTSSLVGASSSRTTRKM